MIFWVFCLALIFWNVFGFSLVYLTQNQNKNPEINNPPYSPWLGLSVCELTECSPRCVRCSLCRITFSILRSVVGVVTSAVRVMTGDESADGPDPAVAVGVHVLPRVRSRNDSSVWVALSSWSNVEVTRLQAGTGRK